MVATVNGRFSGGGSGLSASDIVALDELTAPELTDLLSIIDDPSGTPVVKKATVQAILRAGVFLNPPNIRLSLTTATPVTDSDVTGTSIFATPYDIGGDLIGLHTGSLWELSSFTEKTIDNSGLSVDTNYDVFIYNNSGTLTLSLTAWASATARATALASQNGVLVKTGATTHRYLGTVRTWDNGGTVTFADTTSQRFVWNNYNREERKLKCVDTVNSYTYSTATTRASNADTTLGVNRVAWVQGLSRGLVRLRNHQAFIRGSAAGAVGALVGIGIDSTSANHADLYGSESNTNGQSAPGIYEGRPGIGYHYAQRVESVAGASATTTWQGDNNWNTIQSGMVGSIMA